MTTQSWSRTSHPEGSPSQWERSRPGVAPETERDKGPKAARWASPTVSSWRSSAHLRAGTKSKRAALTKRRLDRKHLGVSDGLIGSGSLLQPGWQIEVHEASQLRLDSSVFLPPPGPSQNDGGDRKVKPLTMRAKRRPSQDVSKPADTIKRVDVSVFPQPGHLALTRSMNHRVLGHHGLTRIRTVYSHSIPTLHTRRWFACSTDHPQETELRGVAPPETD
jgi:hypothetical protein